jgi:voltage-gated potassium channel
MNEKEPVLARFIRLSHEREKNLWRNNLILFLSLVLLIFVEPVLNLKGNILSRLVLATVVISGIFAAEYRKKTFAMLFLVGLLVMIAFMLEMVFPGSGIFRIAGFMLTVFSLILSTVAIVTHVARASSPEGSTIFCAINGYLLIGLTGAILMIITYFIDPSSFRGFSEDDNFFYFIYFSFVTLTTLGYGDISPVTPLARSVSVFIALAGQLYLVINMALLIGKYLNTRNRVN